jgi:hypothetical protein
MRPRLYGISEWAVARSAPHIYVSALPFPLTFSRILDQFLHQFHRTLTFECGRLSHWPALEMTIQAHGHIAYSVALDFHLTGSVSHRPRRIATIRVWDATTGQIVAGSFTGHT